MHLSPTLQHEHDITEGWPYSGLVSEGSVGWAGEAIHDALMTYQYEDGTREWLVEVINDLPICPWPGSEGYCMCECNCDAEDCGDSYCVAHSADQYDSAADFLLAKLIPEFHLLSLSHNRGWRGWANHRQDWCRKDKEPLGLEDITDDDGVQMFGCLLIGALEALFLSYVFGVTLTWRDLRELAWSTLPDEASAIVYPMGIPKSPQTHLALVTSSKIFAIPA